MKAKFWGRVRNHDVAKSAGHPWAPLENERREANDFVKNAGEPDLVEISIREDGVFETHQLGCKMKTYPNIDALKTILVLRGLAEAHDFDAAVRMMKEVDDE